MSSGVRLSKAGAFVSDGAARDVETVGFRPVKVSLYGSNGDTATWSESMASASMVKRTAAGVGTMPTTNGITPLANGFTIGADADLNANGETIHWIAEE
jgi:hypothetical protein